MNKLEHISFALMDEAKQYPKLTRLSFISLKKPTLWQKEKKSSAKIFLGA